MSIEVQDTSIPPVKKRKWLRYLLISLSILVVLGITTVIVLVSYYKSLISKYTQTQPQPLPAFQASEEEKQRLKRRWQEFYQKVQSGGNVQPFRLSADDLNTFLGNFPEARERFRFLIEDDTLKGLFSVPLDQSGKKELQGRHLNGEVKFSVSLRPDGFPELRVTNALVNGRPPPGWAMKRLKAQEFLKDVHRNPELLPFMQNLEDITVEDNHLVLTPLAPQ